MKKEKPILLGERILMRKKAEIKPEARSLPAERSNHNDATNTQTPPQINTTELKPIVSPIDDDVLFSDIVEIPLDQLDSNEAIIRNVLPIRSLEKLINSIKKGDVINPIVARKAGERYKIVCGNRRVVACRKLGRKTIKARLLRESVSITQERLIQLVENIDREDMKPIELARALYNYLEVLRPDLDLAGTIRLFNSFDRMPIPSAQDAAAVAAVREVTGKRSLGTIRNLLNLLKLPPIVIQAIDNDAISYSNGCILAAHLDHPDFDNIVSRNFPKQLKRDELKTILQSSDQAQGTPHSEMYSYLLNRLNTLEKEVKVHLHEVSHEEAQALQEKMKGLSHLMEQQYGGLIVNR